MNISGPYAEDGNFIMFAGNSVTERSTIVSGVCPHPETYSELGQAGHTPDVHIVTGAFIWKVKSVVCNM